MGVGAGLSMYVVVVQKFTFAISSPDEFLYELSIGTKIGALNDLERHNGRYFALFSKFDSFRGALSKSG